LNVLLLRAWLYDDIALEMLLINAQLGNMFLKQSLHLESGKSFRNNVSKFSQALIMSLLNISLPTRASHYVMSFSFPSLDELVIMKATEQYFPVVLSVMPCKVALTFESVNKMFKCDHSDESYQAILSCGAVYCAVKGGSNF